PHLTTAASLSSGKATTPSISTSMSTARSSTTPLPKSAENSSSTPTPKTSRTTHPSQAWPTADSSPHGQAKCRASTTLTCSDKSSTRQAPKSAPSSAQTPIPQECNSHHPSPD